MKLKVVAEGLHTKKSSAHVTLAEQVPEYVPLVLYGAYPSLQDRVNAEVPSEKGLSQIDPVHAFGEASRPAKLPFAGFDSFPPHVPCARTRAATRARERKK